MGNLPSWLQEVISPRPDDSSDLRWAVETVSAMWARGDGRKTLLGLRQAAETARGDGLDARADGLAQAAVEFERLGLAEGTASGEVSIAGAAPSGAGPAPAHAPAPADAPAPAPPPAAPTPTPSPAAPSPRRKLAPTAPYDLPQTLLEAPASDLIEAIRRVDDTEPDHQGPRAESSSRPSRPMPPAVRREPLEPTVVMEEDHELVSSTAPHAPDPPPAPRSSNGPRTLESIPDPLEPMRAVRVAVRLGQGKELSVRLLDDGEVAPEGSQEALLLAIRRTPHD